MMLMLLVAAMAFWRCGVRGGDVAVPTAPSTSTPTERCRGCNPDVAYITYSLSISL
jgi:hypothetical protein